MILVVPVCVVCSLAAVWITDPGSALESVAKLNANLDLLTTGITTSELPNWLKIISSRTIESAKWILSRSWATDLAKWLDIHPIAKTNQLVAEAGVRKGDVNIFTQVGFVVLIGLACKNAILIVEFARVARNKGADARTAVLDACKLRFRPILMTSVAFILGVVPLVVATGAGSEMRQALGVAVIGGMTGVTLFGIFLTPIFFSLVDRLTSTRLLNNKYLVAVNKAALYTLRLKFVRPLAGALVAAAGTRMRKITKRRFGA